MLPPQLPVMRHAELAEVAEHVNATHRQAKRAQKNCSDLYLLLLLHKCVGACVHRVAVVRAEHGSGNTSCVTLAVSTMCPPDAASACGRPVI